MIKIGKVKDAHGLKGELYVLVFSGDISWLKALKSLSLNHKNTTKDYQIQSRRPFKDGFLVFLEGIVDRNQSELLKGAEVYIAQDLLTSKKGETIYLSEIMGFQLYDLAEAEAEPKLLGTISGVCNNGGHDSLVVQTLVEGHWYDLEIPFVSEFIAELKFVEKKVMMNLPPGLVSTQLEQGTRQGEEETAD